jgi:hypothetical protein
VRREKLERSVSSSGNVLNEKIRCLCYPIDRGIDKTVVDRQSDKEFSEMEKSRASGVSKEPDEPCFT